MLWGRDMRAHAAVLLVLGAAACGTVSPLGNDGGAGGSTGAGGSMGAGGSTGTGGSTGAGGAAGAAGSGGGGGSTGAGGGGGATGSGGGGGASGAGGAGGATSPCQAVLALDRSCTTAADCFAGAHVTNCCGQMHFVGFRTSERTQFQTLEAQCDATYPACGCAAGQPTTDDGSRLRFDGQPGVTCLQGTCTTFVPDCGKPCATGTTCFSCSNHSSVFAACTTMCTGNTDCHDPSLPLCQNGSSGNTSGMFCTASNVACDTK
jgi:hypothetical protein